MQISTHARRHKNSNHDKGTYSTVPWLYNVNLAKHRGNSGQG